MFLFTGAVSPVFCNLTWVMTQVNQRAHAEGSDEDDIAAVPTIAAIGTPTRYKFFSAKTDTSVPTIACFDLNPCCVHRFTLLL